MCLVENLKFSKNSERNCSKGFDFWEFLPESDLKALLGGPETSKRKHPVISDKLAKKLCFFQFLYGCTFVRPFVMKEFFLSLKSQGSLKSVSRKF